MTAKSLIPYASDPKLNLRLFGRWTDGGVAEIRAGSEPPTVVPLAAAPWAVMAILIQAAKDAGPDTWGRAFLTVHELAFLLHKKTGLGARDPENIIRLVFRLRRRLAHAAGKRLRGEQDGSAEDWSKRLIERQQFLGYRISLPPENLQLEILDGVLQG
jgi:hypothetical protein